MVSAGHDDVTMTSLQSSQARNLRSDELGREVLDLLVADDDDERHDDAVADQDGGGRSVRLEHLVLVQVNVGDRDESRTDAEDRDVADYLDGLMLGAAWWLLVIYIRLHK